jgi:hypothetical protein
MWIIRYQNHENGGGSIALVATNNTEVQAPPPYLGRMHASLEKEIAFNNRVLEEENEGTHINSEL